MRPRNRILLSTIAGYGSRSLSALVALLVIPFLISGLGVARFGIIGVLQSLLQLFTLLGLGLRPAALRQITFWRTHGRDDRASAITSTAFAVYLGMAALLLSAVILLGRWGLPLLHVPVPFRDESYAALVLAALGTGIGLVASINFVTLGSYLRYDVQHIARMGQEVVYASLVVVGFLLLGPSLPMWGAAFLAGAAVSLIVGRAYRRRICPEIRIRLGAADRSVLSDLGGFSGALGVFAICQWVALRSGPLLLTLSLGPEAVGVYLPALSIIVAVGPLWTSFLWQLQPLITEAWAREDADRVRSLTIRGTRYGILLGGGALVLIGTLAGPFVELWLGPGFRLTAWTLSIWAGVRLCQVTTGAAQEVFLAARHLRSAAIVEVASSALYLALALVLLERTALGILSVPVALGVAQLLRSVVFTRIVAEITSVGALEYARAAFGAPFACLAVLGGTVGIARSLAPAEPIWQLTLPALIGLGVYTGTVWGIGLHEAERGEARGMVREFLAWFRAGPAPEVGANTKDPRE